MKQPYEKPEIEITQFEVEDVMTLSTPDGGSLYDY